MPNALLRDLRVVPDFGVFLANGLPSLFPPPVAGRLRPRLLRLAGVAIGDTCFLPAGLELNGTASLRRNLKLGVRCYINRQVFLDATAPITLGDCVYIGHHTRLITSGHEIGTGDCRAGALTPLPIDIGNGVWIAAGVTILPGVKIGAGAVIAAGAVVTRDVAPNTLVGGVPARVIRAL